MSKFSIDVNKIGKKYRVPKTHYKSGFGRRIASHMKEFFGGLAGLSEQDYFWALRDVSFRLEPGDTLGIVGKNGVGKSTLLKILAGVTDPSEGRASIRGLVGSLLEVGTGFHPDMTGRENIFMAGALLGMKQAEIKRKFDEIVFFSGVEEFLDVPVKRYSSGMYVRLAYAVASHLDTEILILDEVLAVGDAEFQQKSRANISQAANQGKTILFVSHNPMAVMKICKRGMVLDKGRCIYLGEAKEAIGHYLQHIFLSQSDESNIEQTGWKDLSQAKRLYGSSKVSITGISIHKLDGTPARKFSSGEGMRVRINYKNLQAQVPYFSVILYNTGGINVMTLHSTHNPSLLELPPEGVIECVVPHLYLGEGDYSIMLDFGHFGGTNDMTRSLDCVPDATRIKIAWDDYLAGIYCTEYQGVIIPSNWSVC